MARSRGYSAAPPRDCPERITTADDGRVITVQCQRTPTMARRPWHEGWHRAEYGEPIPQFDGPPERRIASWL